MNARRMLLTTATGLFVVIAAVGALVGVGLVLEGRAHADLGKKLTQPMAVLLPGGQVQSVDVTDSPALLAARRDRVQQAVVQGRSEGRDVLVIVREYDRDSHRADSVSWQVEDIAFAPGWTPVTADDGSYGNRARTTIEGHHYEVTASAALATGGNASTAVVQVGALTVDGASLPLADAPPAVRRDLGPVSLPVPDPSSGAGVRSVWFDQQGVGVELYAQDVSTLGT